MADKQVNSSNETRVVRDKTRRCDTCGIEVTYKHFARHLKTAKHIENLNKLHNNEAIVKKDTLKQKVERFKELPKYVDLNLESEQKEKSELFKELPKYVDQNKKIVEPKKIKHLTFKHGLIKKFGGVTMQLRQDKEATDVKYYRENFLKLLKNEKNINYKISLSAQVSFFKNNEKVTHAIQTPYKTVLITKEEEALDECLNYIKTQIDERYFNGSGLTLEKIQYMDLWAAKTKEIKGGCFKTLPFLTKAVINVKTRDNKCFLWSLLAALHPQTDHANEIYKYKQYEHTIKIDTFPVAIKDVQKIEKDNNLKINVFGIKGHPDNILKCVLEPLYLTKEYDSENVIDLLLYNEHFMYIKHLNYFFRNNQSHTKFLCRRCMNAFEREETLKKHKEKCEVHDYCNVTMPAFSNAVLKFKNYNFKNRVPFVIYADFESINILPEDTNEKCNEDSDEVKTKKLKKQIPSAVGVYIHSDYQHLFRDNYAFYRGEDVADVFCNFLIEQEKNFSNLLKTNMKMVLTPEDENVIKNTTECYYCKENLNDDVVRDHDHYNGKFRGLAHNQCNLSAKHVNFVPIFFHNLSNYDAHLFIKTLAKKLGKTALKVLAKTSEQYISFQFGCLRFLDSYRFLQGSLDAVTKSMIDEDFKITRNAYTNDEDFKLLRKKGAIPYSFYTSHKSYEETQLLPEMFFNDLQNEMEPISVYNEAKKIWDHFKCQNHGQFIDLYLKSDVLLLTDLFERFREVNLKYFKIDPCHCYSCPGLTWQAGLSYTNINLELLTDYNTLLTFEKAIRGGISGVMGSRHVKADENSKLLYVDANNLYGWAMMEYLPEKDFKKYEPDFKVTKEWIMSIPDDAETGYFLEVDLEYPDKIKPQSINFPFCPESLFIPNEDLSYYQKSILGTEKRTKVEKLILTQKDKLKYIVHYRCLKFYLDRGMILKNVHSIISFTQRKWLASYIDFNTKQRMVATTDFEKDYFKLMNNAFYGKTCENIRNRKEVELVSEPQRAVQLHSNPRFDSEVIFDENLSAVLMRKTTVFFNKPIYIGATVLELSKLLMYKFYYETLQPYFGEKNLELLYQDTDSFILKITTNDLVKDLGKLRDNFDFSNYPKDHPLFDKSKTKIPGYFKDELGGEEMTEFIGLRSKMYAYKTKNGEFKRLKGISRNVVNKHITFDDYFQALFTEKRFTHNMRVLRSEKHTMHVEEINKKSLNPFDDKRYILDDGIETLPFGYYNFDLGLTEEDKDNLQEISVK